MSLIYDIYRILIDECTEADGPDGPLTRRNRDTFAREFGKLIEDGTFSQSIPSAPTIWKRGWDKPFFSNIRAKWAGPVVNKFRLFFEANLPLIASAHWGITGPTTNSPSSAFHASGAAAGALAGPSHPAFPAAHGLLAALEFPLKNDRLVRNKLFAVDVSAIETVHNQVITWTQAHPLPGALLYRARTVQEDRCLRNAFRLQAAPVVAAIDAIPGYAYTTACHVLADIGYPFYKMDMWVRAFILGLVGTPLSTVLNRGLGDLQRDLLNPDKPESRRFMLDRLDTLLDGFHQDLPELDPSLRRLAKGFQRLRAADFLIAHFGIDAEEEFGLTKRPIDVLLSDPAVAAKYPALAQIAASIQFFATGKDVRRIGTEELHRALEALGMEQPADCRCPVCSSDSAAAEGVCILEGPAARADMVA